MNIIYKHTQIGHLTIFLLVIGLLPLMLIPHYDFYKVMALLVIITGIVLALMYSLTVIITEDKLIVRFGIGFINIRFTLSDIVSCQTVKNPWYYGWGIHMLPKGWIYNVSGFNAIEITMSNGKVYRIGTDEPQKLEQALSQAIQKQNG